MTSSRQRRPDVSFFSRLRFVRLSAYAGSELTYFHNYESERSVGYDRRGARRRAVEPDPAVLWRMARPRRGRGPTVKSTCA